MAVRVANGVNTLSADLNGRTVGAAPDQLISKQQRAEHAAQQCRARAGHPGASSVDGER